MRNLVLSLFFFGIISYVGYIMYTRHISLADDQPLVIDSSGYYPVIMTVESLDGRSMDVELLGRNRTHIQFNRITDGKFFDYLISSLESKVRAKVEAMPLSSNEDFRFNQPDHELEGMYIKELRAELEKVRAKMMDVSKKASISVSQIERRTLQREFEKLQSEDLKLQKLILERQ